VFLQGTLDGRLTIAAENNVILFSDVTYVGGQGGDDILGLVANNYVEVYHPVSTASVSGWPSNCDGTYTGGTDSCNLRIPGSSTSTRSLFTGATPGSSTMATQVTNYALRNPTFSGPVLTVAHSFRVQNYQYGLGSTLGTMTLFGAIAQKYRGIVSTFNTSNGSIITGYAKNYVYDQRLKYDSPPKFLNPVASAWQVVTWSETNTGYEASDP
jgi:hypothetical protein